MTTTELAEKLKVRPYLVAKWCRRGELPASRPGRDWIIGDVAMDRARELAARGRGRPRKEDRK